MIEENELVAPQLKKALSKLISEEYFVYQACIMAMMAVKREEADVIKDLLEQIGTENLMQHMANLIDWCRSVNCEIPCSESEFKKSASAGIKKLADMKKNQAAGFYISQIGDIIELMAQSYKQVLESRIAAEFTDLQGIFWQSYYHLEESCRRLCSAQIAYDADASLIMQ